jgi:hypothetical protein
MVRARATESTVPELLVACVLWTMPSSGYMRHSIYCSSFRCGAGRERAGSECPVITGVRVNLVFFVEIKFVVRMYGDCSSEDTKI